MNFSFFDNWFEKKYTHAEVRELIERIKAFNAGIIDEHLNKHVEKEFAAWVESHK